MNQTIADLQDRLTTGTTSTQLVDEALAKIKESAEFNAVLATFDDAAQNAAQNFDALSASQKKELPLGGIPFLVKINTFVEGQNPNAASKILQDFIAPHDSDIVKLLKEAGAIPIGFTNMDAFGHGSSTENSAFGPTLNPSNKEYTPGGSSGGSAASVALGQVTFATGTDTGGSIRLPASYCGVYSIKPSYGAVSRYGVVAMASSTDTIGILTNNLRDLKTIYPLIARPSSCDQNTIHLNAVSPKKPKIGIIKQLSDAITDPESAEVYQKYINDLKATGHEIVEVDFELIKNALSVYYIVVSAEISSNLSRFDGIRYGKMSDRDKELHAAITETRKNNFMPENIRRIMIGTYVLSAGYYDAYFKKAAKVRTLLLQEINSIFENVDMIITPVASTPAFKLGSIEDPLGMYKTDLLTVPFSLTGNPCIVKPLKKEGMPFGVQLIGKYKDDLNLLNFAEGVDL